ncbi:MAG: M23 family metallopeptidase [Clostridia bacterium]|nr:M23 family metallopeptidase [Clostridia bacterium]
MDEEKNEKSRSGDNRSAAGRRMRVAGAVYIALAVCVVTVMVLSVYSVSVTVPEEIDVTLPEMSNPHFELPKENIREESQGVPVSHEQSGVTAESPDGTPAEPLYYKPVKGKTLKGYRMTSLVYSATLKDYRTHSGVDIAGKIGDKVVCYCDGVVKSVRNDPFMGVTVEVEHEYGLVSVYQNLASELPSGIKAGAAVKGGSVIGAIGETAVAESADEAHLHFELILDGKQIDAEKELARIK